jgi:hypothetical protein
VGHKTGAERETSQARASFTARRISGRSEAEGLDAALALRTLAAEKMHGSFRAASSRDWLFTLFSLCSVPIPFAADRLRLLVPPQPSH